MPTTPEPAQVHDVNAFISRYAEELAQMTKRALVAEQIVAEQATALAAINTTDGTPT